VQPPLKPARRVLRVRAPWQLANAVRGWRVANTGGSRGQLKRVLRSDFAFAARSRRCPSNGLAACKKLRRLNHKRVAHDAGATRCAQAVGVFALALRVLGGSEHTSMAGHPPIRLGR
jgi:hypothetical protein